MLTDPLTNDPLTNFHLPLDLLLSLGFYAVIGAYAVFTFMMYYHWKEYSVDDKVTKITLILYCSLTLPLVLVLSLLTLFS